MSEIALTDRADEIKAWVEEGRTDAWIAHQLAITGEELQNFKVELGLAEAPAEAAPSEEASPADNAPSPTPPAPSAQPTSGDQGGTYEASLDSGNEGYGLWFDPAVADDPVYKKNWASTRGVTVTVEADQIVIKKA